MRAGTGNKRRPKSKRRRRKSSRRRLKWLSPWLVIPTTLLACFLTLLAVQLVRKPTELLSGFAGDRSKAIAVTWQDYGDLFEEHATGFITADFLAALAQIESGGRALASPDWDVRFQRGLFDIYSPPTSAVGLMQFTEATFRDANRYCIHNHKVVADGPWYDPSTCWFNWLGTRLSPSDSIEAASAHLYLTVRELERDYPGKRWTLSRRQQSAAVAHLCGGGRAVKFVQANFKLSRLRRCGSHSAVKYVRKLQRVQHRFLRL